MFINFAKPARPARSEGRRERPVRVVFSPVSLFSLVGLLLFVTPIASAARGSETASATPSAPQSSGTPPYKHPKLQTILASLASAVPQERGPWTTKERTGTPPGFAMEAMPKAVQDAAHSGMMRINQRGEVQVYVLVTATEQAALDSLKSAGAGIEIVDSQNRIVQARVPMTRLEAVGALPVVRFVTLPNYGFPLTGAVESQGDSIIKATDVRAMYHVDGTGVRVGAISDGLKGIFAACPASGIACTVAGTANGPIATGDLPAAMGTRNANGTLTSATGGITAKSFSANQDLEGLPPAGCGFPGAGAEGTALLEIVHDVAPGAQLYFANFDTSMAFEQAVDYIASNVDVGLDDIGFYGYPYDGTSPVSANTSAQLNSSTNPVRAWTTAVGNAAVNHYYGAYVDSHVDGTALVGAAGDLHLFQANSTTSDVLKLGPTVTDKVVLPPNGEIIIILTWNDPFGASTNDYDLYLVQESTGTVVASSTSPQTGTQDPVEFIDYTSPATTPQGDFEIIIQNAGNKAAIRNLNMFLFSPECAKASIVPILPPNVEQHNYNTPSTSVAAESDAGGSPVSVVAVGAICSGVPQCPSYPNDPDHTQIEYFSSMGPTTDGRTKPDITGIDGVSITGAGDFENPFFGTSAATPHAGATDALLLQLAPCLLTTATGAILDTTARENLHTLLLGSADAIGSPIPNNTYGYGRVDALNAAEKEIPTVSAPASEIASAGGGALQATGVDPNGCPLTYSWTGSCGTGMGPMPAPDCAAGANTVSLSVSNNGVTFSGAASIKVTATSFGLSALPASDTVTAGQSAKYTVSVNPQLGAFGNAVALACASTGLPAETTCAFSPSSVTPGSAGITSTLTLTTTAGSAVPAPSRWPSGPAAPLLGLMALGAGLLVLLRFRRNMAPKRPAVALVLAIAFLGALLGYAACGGGGSSYVPPAVNSGTPAGTYKVTVSGTAGSLSESTTVTLVVQ